MMLFANCSESTCRINTINMSDQEIKDLKKQVMKLIVNELSDEDNEGTIINNNDLDGIEEKFEASSSDTSVSDNKIFGTSVLTIDGDFPYNNSSALESFLEGRHLEYEYEER